MVSTASIASLQDTAEEAICLLDPDGTVLACSSPVLRLLGMQVTDVVHQPCRELFCCTSALEKQCPRKRAVESGKRAEAAIKRGASDLVETAEPLFDKSGILLVVALRFSAPTTGHNEPRAVTSKKDDPSRPVMSHYA